MNDRRGNKRGFTIVELLIAMMVMAILASVAYPSFMQSVRKSKRTDAETVVNADGQ